VTQTSKGVVAAGRRDQAVETGKALLLARAHFSKSWLAYWVNEVGPCDDDTAYRLVELFRQEVEVYFFDLKRRDVGVRHAANEMFRKWAVGQADYTWEELLGFVRWYDLVSNHKIGVAIAHLFEYHGDGFSDLCIALPLAGKRIVERCYASHLSSDKPRREGFLDPGEIAAAVEEALGDRWRKLISAGENYVESALTNQAEKWFLNRLRSARDNENGWTPEEQELLSHSHFYED